MSKLKKISIILALFFLYFLGIFLRSHSFEVRSKSYDDLFWMETAQHAYHAKMISQNKTIPQQETKLQHPDGYNTKIDTIVEEYLAGWTYRLFFTHIPFEIYLRYFIRFLFCLAIFAIYGIAREVSDSHRGGLIAAAFFAVAMPAIERSMGDTFFREHLAIPLLTFQIWFMVKALNNGHIRDIAFSGILYFVALVSWRVINFYTLILFSFFALAYIIGISRTHVFKVVLSLVISIVAGTLLFDVNLRYDTFLLSPQMMLGYGIIIMAWCNKKLPHRWQLTLILALVMIIGVVITPKTGLYNHVWETIFFQIKYLGQKPSDPSLLSFDARHYWVPPYTSPSLLRFFNEMFLPLLLASYALILSVYKLWHNKLSLSLACLLYLFVALFSYYLFSYKIKTFVIIFISVFIGVGVIWAKNKQKLATGIAILAIFFQLYQVYSWNSSLWLRGLLGINIKPRAFASGVPHWSYKDALLWIDKNIEKDQAIIADIGFSPMISYYAERPTVMHAYFETGIRKRYKELAFALFSHKEDELLAFCKKYKAQYIVLSGDMLLRIDPDMSYRYITNNLKLNPNWTIYKMHFQTKSLKHFSKIYQNPMLCIYQLAKPKKQIDILPVFDETLFKDMSYDTTAQFWHTMISGYWYMRQGKKFLEQKKYPLAITYLQRSIKIIPTFSESYQTLAEVYKQLKQPQKAKECSKYAKQAKKGWALWLKERQKEF